jgi:putative transposase
VTAGLKRYYLEGFLHFITFSCYRRRAHLTTPSRRDLFLRLLEHARRRYTFALLGYVLMPEHVHLPMTMPAIGDPSLVMKVVKERFTRLLRKREAFTGPVWQKRFYDFNVCTEKKRVEKLRYMHRNPVKRGLVERPEDWPWSSYRHYLTGEPSVVEIESKGTWKRRLAMGIVPQMRVRENPRPTN